MPTNGKKEYAENGLEQDVLYARRWYCYLQNNLKLKRWVKRTMSKRFRRRSKMELKPEIGLIEKDVV